MRLADLPSRLHEFDIVVSSTASSLPIIGLGAVERALKARRHRPMFMVDLAVPRDIEPEVSALDDVYLYTVDDLAPVVQTGRREAPGRRRAGRGHHRCRGAELRALAGPARRVPLIQAPEPAGGRLARRRTRARPQAACQGRGRGRGARGPLARPHPEDAARRHGGAARRRRRARQRAERRDRALLPAQEREPAGTSCRLARQPACRLATMDCGSPPPSSRRRENPFSASNSSASRSACRSSTSFSPIPTW